MNDNQLILGDSLEILKTFPDNSIDAIITDPPYGIKLDKWDVVIDIEGFTLEVKRLLNDGFYCFFGQMPTVINWINHAHNNLVYRDQIIWVKRNTAISKNLQRAFENIYIYASKRKNYHNTVGKYSDVKVPGLLYCTSTIEAIDRYIKDLWLKIKRNDFSPTIKHSNKRQSIFSWMSNEYRNNSDRSPEMTNFTNVWSFFPPNLAKKDGFENKLHPTRKPLELIKRLVELTTKEGDTVLDPFGGSGTTAIACLELNRNYIVIEKEEEYYEIAKKRIEQWHNEKKDKQPDYELPEDIEREIVSEGGQLKLF